MFLRVILLTVITISFLTACAGNRGRETGGTAAEERLVEETETAVFQATVLEVSENSCLVEPDPESAAAGSADRIYVPVWSEGPMPEVGDIIEITYDGWIAESYPAQIMNVYGIRVVEQGSGDSDSGEEDGTPEWDGIRTVDGEHFSARVLDDGTLILDLDANATTGYAWVITEEPENFASDYDVYIEPDNKNQIVGVGGIAEFHIIALKEGTGTMVFEYKRPWEGGETAGSYALTLTISGDSSSGLQIDHVSFESLNE